MEGWGACQCRGRGSLAPWVPPSQTGISDNIPIPLNSYLWTTIIGFRCGLFFFLYNYIYIYLSLIDKKFIIYFVLVSWSALNLGYLALRFMVSPPLIWRHVAASRRSQTQPRTAARVQAEGRRLSPPCGLAETTFLAKLLSHPPRSPCNHLKVEHQSLSLRVLTLYNWLTSVARGCISLSAWFPGTLWEKGDEISRTLVERL